MQTAQYQKTVNPREKMGQRSKWMYLQRRHRDGHKAREKMLSITVREMPIKLQRGVSSPPQNDHPLKHLQRFSASEGKGSRDSSCTVGGDGNERVRPLRKTVWRFLKALSIVTT